MSTAVEEARPACLAQAYDLEMKLIGADAARAARNTWSIWVWRLTPCSPVLDKPGRLPHRSRRLRPLLGELDAYRAEMCGF